MKGAALGRWRNEQGQVGGIEVLPFGLLVFVAGSLLIANAWAVVDAKLAVTAAAREATRAYVEAPDAVAAQHAARARARETLSAYGRGDDGRVDVDVGAEQRLVRCARVSITVTYEVPALTVPFVGGFGGAIHAKATHTELVDPYRDGLEDGAC
ncbi:MAG TPA: hypothetical protein VGQ20_07070 [Acidimicrobiales bacterium]|nr:hypothetical protein [Acidimicrobiales bacterium]